MKVRKVQEKSVIVALPGSIGAAWSLDIFVRRKWQSQRDCRHSAQGCVLRSSRYPGFALQKWRTLKGFHHWEQRTHGLNPFRVRWNFDRLPRVARSSQPWAEGFQSLWDWPQCRVRMSKPQGTAQRTVPTSVGPPSLGGYAE